MTTPPKQGAVTRAEFAALSEQVEKFGKQAEAAARISGETHELVVDLNKGLMQPPPGQDKSLLYQIAQMLEEWKRHKWAFQTVIWLAGAVVTLAAAIVAVRHGFWGAEK